MLNMSIKQYDEIWPNVVILMIWYWICNHVCHGLVCLRCLKWKASWAKLFLRVGRSLVNVLKYEFQYLRGAWHAWAGMPWQTVEIYTSHRRNNGWVTPGGAEWVGGVRWVVHECSKCKMQWQAGGGRESRSEQRNKQRGTRIKLSARVHYFNATWRSLAAIAIASH